MFVWHHWSKIFQMLHDYNLALGLNFQSRFDDFDSVSRSQVCQKYKLQIVLFRFLSTVFLMLYGCYIHEKDHVQYELCNSDVCSREIIYVVLVDQVSGLVKLCMIWTLLRIYIFILGLMTLTLFQGHRCVRNINCKLCFLDTCLL